MLRYSVQASILLKKFLGKTKERKVHHEVWRTLTTASVQEYRLQGSFSDCFGQRETSDEIHSSLQDDQSDLLSLERFSAIIVIGQNENMNLTWK
jgi:hypothetical protein